MRALGGKVVLHGDNYDAAYAHERRIASKRRLAFVHPYDDPDVIAGQGTIGLEILKQHTHDLDAIFVPVGGGGLIAGIARPATRPIDSSSADISRPADASPRLSSSPIPFPLTVVSMFC